jgi:acyl-CoA thioester hydrolase
VRYAETDKMGVVYYANYFVWMEVGRTDYCKSIGFSYREMEHEDANMAVVDASCRYIAPARYDDEILVPYSRRTTRPASCEFRLCDPQRINGSTPG